MIRTKGTLLGQSDAVVETLDYQSGGQGFSPLVVVSKLYQFFSPHISWSRWAILLVKKFFFILRFWVVEMTYAKYTYSSLQWTAGFIMGEQNSSGSAFVFGLPKIYDWLGWRDMYFLWVQIRSWGSFCEHGSVLRLTAHLLSLLLLTTDSQVW